MFFDLFVLLLQFFNCFHDLIAFMILIDDFYFRFMT